MISTSFTKLFAGITDSSIWSEDSDTKVVWVTMLAMCDQFGRVNAAIPGLSKRAGVSIEGTQKALNKFLAPDPFSRTKEHEGRRIEDIEGGWRLLNYEIYRELKSEEDRKEQNRLSQQRRRDKLRHQDVSNGQQKSAESAQGEAEEEAEAEEDKEEEKKQPRKGKPLDDEWLKEVKSKYPWLDFDKEMSKMQGWLLSPKGANRKMTRQFVINWLNRCDQPVSGTFQPQTSNRGKI